MHRGTSARFHPNGVKARPWDTQKISRVGQHIEGVRKPPPHHEEVKCVKIGENVQRFTVQRPVQMGGEWETDNPYVRSSEAVGMHHVA